jgi:hypothetical protein
MQPQPWPNSGPIQQIYQAAYQQALLHRPKFIKLLAKVVESDDFELKPDIKRFASFENKVKRGKEPNAIHDMLRAAILTNDPDENDDVAHRIDQFCNVIEQEFKTHNESGYRGAYHFKILVGDMICEIQTMSKNLWAFKEAAHPCYDRQKHGTEDVSMLGFTKWLYDTAQKSERR